MIDSNVTPLITIFVNLGHFEIVTNIRTWIKPHRCWRMLYDANTLKRVFILTLKGHMLS